MAEMSENYKKRVRILGIPVDLISMQSAIRCIDDHIRQGDSMKYVVAMNPEKIIVARKDESIKRAIMSAGLLIPDGIGVLCASRLLYGVGGERVTGADLMMELCGLASQKGYRIFLYGGAEEVNSAAAGILAEKMPGLIIAGRSNGFVKPEDMDKLIVKINESKADIVFVALGSPAQENWIYSHRERLKTKICQGIGGTLDTITGRVKRAPKIFQNLGLEWFYRLIKQPSRAPRHIRLLYFAWEVFKEKVVRLW